MKVLILNQAEVAQLLPMDECMEVMGEALKAQARGEAMSYESALAKGMGVLVELGGSRQLKD